VRAWDREGRDLDFEVKGLTAGTFQHEIDHLDGKLFVDYLSELKRERLKKKASKKAKRAAEDAADARARKSVPVI
jgi:peptide deformylase